ncbi:MAG: hypothetical protein ACI39U_01965, partial [Candidatus Cryptobacteroides sp.]
LRNHTFTQKLLEVCGIEDKNAVLGMYCISLPEIVRIAGRGREMDNLPNPGKAGTEICKISMIFLHSPEKL